MPVVVPPIPMSVLGHDSETGPFPGMAGALGVVTPSQTGSTSRIGGSIYGMVPDPAGAPPETDLETAWGFMAGKAPPGTSSLNVSAGGTAFIRGNCYAHSGGFAVADGSIYVIVDEFEPVVPEHDPSFSRTTHDYETVEIDPDRSAALRSPPPDPNPLQPPETVPFLSTGLAWTQRVGNGAWTALLDLETAVLGWRVSALDTHPAATMVVVPVTPGRSYLWWIACYQYVGVATAGAAVSNIAFDFGPVIYAFG
jgi:hypothetical protein